MTDGGRRTSDRFVTLSPSHPLPFCSLSGDSGGVLRWEEKCGARRARRYAEESGTMGSSGYWDRRLARRVSRRGVARGGALGAAALGLAACTSSTEVPTAAAPLATAGATRASGTPGAGAAPVASPAAPAAKYGGTMRPEASTGKPPNMDIHGTATFSLHS